MNYVHYLARESSLSLIKKYNYATYNNLVACLYYNCYAEVVIVAFTVMGLNLNNVLVSTDNRV